jgi:hypothetical protein
MEEWMRKEERAGMERSRGTEREGRVKEFERGGSIEASRVRGMALMGESLGMEGGSMDMVRERA